jgi:diadenylate cyclase
LFEGVANYIGRVLTDYNPLVVAVELFLIGWVVWWVTRFLRGTRGARLIKGFGLMLVVVYVVIRLLPQLTQGDPSGGWERAEFLYGRFLLFAFVALVVAFQPELRRALIHLGQTSIFHSQRGAEILAESLGYLSRNKIGALIAVERSAGLGALMESGTILDCELSAEMLNTIFYPGSALHDMGVVLSRGRIGAAGCQFPLAESGEVDASLGSRHRAALGLSHECDAVILVVSEETGRVSLACEGQLYLGLSLSDLREMVITFLSPSGARHHRFRGGGGEA